MEFEDFLEPEVGIAAAVVAVIASPQARKIVRRGAVYGLAGVLMAGDVMGAFVRGVRANAQQAMQEGAQASTQNDRGKAALNEGADGTPTHTEQPANEGAPA